MSRSFKRRLRICGAIVAAIALATYWSIDSSRSAAADSQGPVSIIASSVTIEPPRFGGRVRVSGSVDGTYHEDGAPLAVWARSITRDQTWRRGEPLWQRLDVQANRDGEPAEFTGTIFAAFGDLIEIRATNVFYGIERVDRLAAGFVPAGRDADPPRLERAYIDVSRTEKTIHVVMNAYYAIDDDHSSYPMKVALFDDDDPTNVYRTEISSTSDDFPQSVSISIPDDRRARLVVTDAYGNSTSQLYDPSSFDAPEATGLFYAEANPSPAERTGQHAHAGKGVHLHNGGFVHAEPLFRIEGRVLSLDVSAVYRSRIHSDGILGVGWDSILSSRVSVDASADITLYPGDGRAESFPFQPSGTLAEWSSPAGVAMRMKAVGGRVTSELRNGQTLVYSGGWLERIEDPHGNSIRFERDRDGKVVRIGNDRGNLYHLTYSAHGRLTEVVDFVNHKTSIDHDHKGNIVGITDPGGLTRRFEYRDGRLVRIIDRDGRTYVENEYDGAGRVVRQSVPLGTEQREDLRAHGSWSFDYRGERPGDATLTTVVVTDPVGTESEYVLRVAHPVGLLAEVSTRENNSLRERVVGYEWSAVPREVVRCVEHDLRNLMPRRTWVEADSGSGREKVTPYTRYIYEDVGSSRPGRDPRRRLDLRAKIVDRAIGDDLEEHPATVELWSYSEYGRVERHVSEQTWSRTADGDEEKVDASKLSWGEWETQLGELPTTVRVFDDVGNLMEIRHPDVSVPQRQSGVVESFTYNEFGQLLSSTSATGVTRRFEYYDSGVAAGRLAREWIDVSGTQADPSDWYEYDIYGNVSAHTNGNGARTDFFRDALGRVIEQRDPATRYLDSLSTYFKYEGTKLAQIVSPNRDELGRVPVGQPAEIVESRIYDERSGALVKIVHDVSASQDAETRFEYDTLGRRVRAYEQFRTLSDGTKLYGVSEISYDELGREIRSIRFSSDPDDGSSEALFDDRVENRYFDAGGELIRTQRQVERAGAAMRYHVTTLSTGYRDAPGPTSVVEGTPALGSYRYRVERVEEPDGTIDEVVTDTLAAPDDWCRRESTFSVDADGSLTEIERSEYFVDERSREYRRRVYFELGRQKRYFDEETWSNEGGQTVREYDEYTGTDEAAPFRLFTYDEAGRLESESSPQGKVERTYSYDAVGNVISSTVVESVESSDGIEDYTSYTSTYTYDARGRRLSETVAGRSRYFFPDSFGRVRREIFSDLGLETRTVFDLAGNVVETRELIDRAAGTWKRTSYLHDLRGRVLAQTTASPADPNQRVSKLFLRDPYGHGRVEFIVLPGVCTVDEESGEWCEIDGEAISENDKYRYEYDLADRVVATTDPNGSVIENRYDSRRPGVLNDVFVTPAPHVAGPTHVSYEYSEEAACGCSGVSPTRVVTRDANGACRTRVDQSFDALGRIVGEETRVCTECPGDDGLPPCSSHIDASYVLRYERDTDADGIRRDDTLIVEPTGALAWAPYRVRNVFDANGRLVEGHTDLFSRESGERVFARLWYQGVDKIAESHFEYARRNGSANRVVRHAGYHAGEGSRRTRNQWGAQHRGDVREAWSPVDPLYDWSGEFDEAERIEARNVGPEGYEASYTFDFDGRGLLRNAKYDWPDDADTDAQWRDARTFDYTWNERGDIAGVAQCFSPSGDDRVCESGYTFVRDERGRVVRVDGVHVLAYHRDGGIARAIGPQTRTYDNNGNLLSNSFEYRTSNPGQHWKDSAPQTYCDREICDDLNLRSETLVHWSFTYNVWNQPVSATRSVIEQTYSWEGDPDHDGCCRDVPMTLRRSAMEWLFENDGHGRRAMTRIVKHGFDADVDGSGVTEQAWLNGFDDMGRMIFRADIDGDANEESIYYAFANEALPALGVFSSGNAAGVPHFFLSEVEGNAGALLNAVTLEASDEKSTQHCGSVSKNGSNPQARQEHTGNVYGNRYGDTEDGFQLVEDPNCSPMVLTADGSRIDTEMKERSPARGKSWPPVLPPQGNARDGFFSDHHHQLLGITLWDADVLFDAHVANYSFNTDWRCHCKDGAAKIERPDEPLPEARAKPTKYGREQDAYTVADFPEKTPDGKTRERWKYRGIGSWEETSALAVVGGAVAGGVAGANAAGVIAGAPSVASGPFAPAVYTVSVLIGAVGGAATGAAMSSDDVVARYEYRFVFSCSCLNGKPKFRCHREDGDRPKDAGDLYWKHGKPEKGRCR